MKYILMCGGNYKDQFDIPKPLLEINGEKLVERTIRLLKENSITDIAISTDIEDYNCFGVEILKNTKQYIHDKFGNVKKSENAWLNAYYPLEVPTCYLAGDVYWTNDALKKIINTKVKETMFICAPGYDDGRKHPSIKGKEPLGYKVEKQDIFRKAINEMLKEIDEGKFGYDPIAWNLYRKLNNIKIDYNGLGNDIFRTKGDFLVIDDLTTDIDCKKDIPNLERLIKIMEGGNKMVKVKVIENFHLGRFNELQNIQRVSSKNSPNYLYVGDVFECTEEMAEYLTKTNSAQRAFIEIIEVIPEKQEEVKQVEIKQEETKQEKPIRKRRTSKKNIENK